MVQSYGLRIREERKWNAAVRCTSDSRQAKMTEVYVA